MNYKEFKELLEGYTKEEIIEAVLTASICDWMLKKTVAENLKAIKRKEKEERLDSLSQRNIQSLQDYVDAKKKYSDFLYETAEKYHIVIFNDKNDGYSFNWGDWFKVTTDEEKETGRILENDMIEKFKAHKEIEKKWAEALHS